MLQQSVNASLRLLRLAPRLAPRLPSTAVLSAQLPTSISRQLLNNHHSPQYAAARRLYSAVAEANKENGDTAASASETQNVDETKETGDSKAASETESPDAELKKALEAKNAEIKEWKDVAMRSKAEFLNLQSRSARDQKAAREFAIQSFAKDLLENIDNLDRALTTVPQAKLDAAKAAGDNQSEDLKDLVNLYEGLRLTESGLMQTLSRHGLVRFDPLNEKFNPNEQEATFMTPQPDKEDGIVFHVQQKGFKLNGRVVRAAKVGVVKNK